jgi:hypothetical protein
MTKPSPEYCQIKQFESFLIYIPNSLNSLINEKEYYKGNNRCGNNLGKQPYYAAGTSSLIILIINHITAAQWTCRTNIPDDKLRAGLVGTGGCV